MSTPQFYDSIQRQPLAPPSLDRPISFYACGITPYSDSHIGHARSFVVFDLMRRTLERAGHSVVMVRNITDVDDKIIAKSQELGVSWDELSHSMAQTNRALMEQLGVFDYEEPKASEHIPAIIDLVTRLMDKGHAYVGDTGDVLYSVQSFAGSALMPHDLDNLGRNDDGPRVAHEGKRDNRDFVLWKGAKEGEPSWPSPWGAGRPGWHIECSAMIEQRFGTTVDYHGGGTDLRFPHHQAEIQQSEAAFDRPLAHRWVHHGSVRDNDGQKMSKSLGNVVLLKDALADAEVLAPNAGGAVVRWALLSALWTKPLDWSLNALNQSAQQLKAWSTWAKDAPTLDANHPDVQALSDTLNNNLNTPAFGAHMHKMLARAKTGDASASAVLSLGLQWLGITPSMRLALQEEVKEREIPEHIQELLNERDEWRAIGNYEAADRIRDELRKEGWDIQDKPVSKKPRT